MKDKELSKEIVINSINSLCKGLDFLASSNIEEKMVCPLDCCIGNYTLPLIEDFIESDDYEDIRSIIGDTGVKLLIQLHKGLDDDACYFDDEKGFSKKQRWIDFVKLVNAANIHLKQSLAKI